MKESVPESFTLDNSNEPSFCKEYEYLFNKDNE